MLAQAMEVGVYNHIPGDGREFVVCDPTAVKVPIISYICHRSDSWLVVAVGPSTSRLFSI